MTLAHAMPQLEFRPPLCPFCDEDLNYEDGWDCADCQMWWHSDGRFGERMNAPDPICGAENTPYLNYAHRSMQEQRYRCMLDQHHELPHRGVRIDQATGQTHDWYKVTTAAHV
jgi:hypothetical protein